jgi:hypothetical protein
MGLYAYLHSIGEITGGGVFIVGAIISGIGGIGFLILSRTSPHKTGE